MGLVKITMPKCKLYLKDEVNCKFEGLDLTDRRKLSNKFKFDIPHARFMPAVRLGRWDGKISFFQLGGSTFINLLPDILDDISNYKKLAPKVGGLMKQEIGE